MGDQHLRLLQPCNDLFRFKAYPTINHSFMIQSLFPFQTWARWWEKRREHTQTRVEMTGRHPL